MHIVMLILALSVACQVASAVLALRLIRVTGRTTAWYLIAFAITLMALRRIESLGMAVSGASVATSTIVFESVGLATSVLMLAGISRIRPLFIALAGSQNELRAMNAKLAALFQEQQVLLEHTKDFIYRHNTDGMITYVSPAVEKITGYTPAEWLVHYTRHYTNNPVNLRGRDITEAMLKSAAGGPSYIVEVKHRNGGTVWLEVNKQPYLAEGKVAGVIGVARDISARVKLEQDREKLITDLQEALASIKTLKGLLPICASCKKIRDDKGYWNQIEAFVSEHSEAEFSHGICPECAKRLYPQFYRDTPESPKT